MIESFWSKINESRILQGDFLTDCNVPVSPPNYSAKQPEEIQVDVYDLIVVTQSCDLVNNKAKLVAACPIYPISEFEKGNPDFIKRSKWNEVRRGRFEGLHLLGSPLQPSNNSIALVVNFREIYSLPHDYLIQHAVSLGERWRLRSPYLEHFSQALARFFMRVGLPSEIPEFK